MCVRNISPDLDFTFSKRFVMYYTESVDEIEKGWQQHTSGLVTADKGTIIS